MQDMGLCRAPLCRLLCYARMAVVEVQRAEVL